MMKVFLLASLLSFLHLQDVASFSLSRPPLHRRSGFVATNSYSSSSSSRSVMVNPTEELETQTMAVKPSSPSMMNSTLGAPSLSRVVGEAAAVTASPPTSMLSSLSSSLPDWVEPLAWRGSVVVLCALWASNFAVVKLIMAEPGVDSSLYAVTRFAVAAGALAPFAWNVARKRGMDLSTLWTATQCGAWVAFGYLGQSFGLITTTASKSCVICSLHCVFVALVAESMRVAAANSSSQGSQQAALQQQQQESESSTSFDYMRLVPALIAVLGVAIVELQGAAGPPTIGDALSFAQPIGFGMGYLQLEHLMSKRPDLALPVSAIKLLVVAIASLAVFQITPFFDQSAASTMEFMLRLPDLNPILSSPVALGGILYTGLVTTALALWFESIAFARVPATDASIILTTEPIFAAGFGAIMIGETFGLSDYVGASLIIGACVLAALLDTPGETGEECEVTTMLEQPEDKMLVSAAAASEAACDSTQRKWPHGGF